MIIFLKKKGEFATLDDKLKKFIKSEGILNSFEIKVPENSEKSQKDKMETFSKTAMMFKAKDDMLKIFGEDDTTFNMKDEDGNPKNKAAADMENHMKNTFKAVRLSDALNKNDYDTVLKIAGFGDDYSKLNEALDYAKNTIDQFDINKELQIEEKEFDDNDFAL